MCVLSFSLKVYSSDYDTQAMLYEVEPPVHQWIAFQAYNKLPSGSLKDELSGYLPTSTTSLYYSETWSAPSGWSNNGTTPYESTTALIEGAWEEDKESTDVPFNHFWDPDSAYDNGLPFYDSALERAQENLWQEAIAAYNVGDKALAYYRLGRIAHLLMDMSVPAHSLLDTHWPDDDQYEKFTKTGSNYKNIISSSSNTAIPIISGLPNYPYYTPGSYNNSLTKLFYSLAEKSDDFDSDDETGEGADYGRGKYTLAKNTLNSSKTFTRAEYWGVLSKIRTLTDYNDYDIFSGCSGESEYSIYYYESFYNEINNTANRVKIFYTDGTEESFWNLDEFSDVPNTVLKCIYQPQLQARAVGYVAALYQLFWDSVEHPDTAAPTPDPMTWATEPYAVSDSSIAMVATTASDSSGVEYYFDETSGNSGGSDSGWQNDTTYTDNGLQPNTTYTYKVMARDKSSNQNETDWSVSKSATTLGPPSVPASISYPSSSSTGQYTISWSSSNGATSYQLERSDNGGASWLPIYSDPETSYPENIGNGSYRYRVKATNSYGSSDWQTSTWDCVVNIPPPLPPVSISYPSNSDTGQYTVSWSSSSGAAFYQLEKSIDGVILIWLQVYDGPNTFYNESIGNGTYRYRVKASNSQGSSEWLTGTNDCVVTIANPYGGGNGTIQEPYLIYTAEQMNFIGISPGDWDKNFKLMANINLLAYYGTKFNIIGSYASGLRFSGAFEGNSHIISNLNLGWGSCGDIGLFGRSSGQICNLGLENTEVHGGWNVGSLVGDNNGIIKGCYSIGSVNGYSMIGGLVGCNGGTITGCYYSGGVDGYELVGGLVGFNCRDITNCFATGWVNGNNGTDVGGLVGENRGGIRNCYATGNVFAYYHQGGLVGYNDSGNISNCYATGMVTGLDYGGGLVALNEYGIVSNSFWDIETSSRYWSDGGTGKTTAEMQDINTFLSAGWDFVGETENGYFDIWRICENGQYPKLSWQFSPGDFGCPDGTDIYDLAILTDQWLLEKQSYDLNNDGIVNFLDFAVFANSWQGDMAQLSEFASQWLQPSAYCADIAPAPGGDGIVNFLDFAAFAEHWLEEN